MNLPVENPLNDDFHWPDVLLYRFQIQSLTWTLHCKIFKLAASWHILKILMNLASEKIEMYAGSSMKEKPLEF